MPSPDSSRSASALVATLRREASELRFRVGRYHGEGAVDRHYMNASGLMEDAAKALSAKEAALREQIAADLRAESERAGDWYGGTTDSAIHVVLNGPRKVVSS